MQEHVKHLETAITRRTTLSLGIASPHPPHKVTATLHEKTQGPAPQHPPQKKSHATFVLPLQCALHCQIANPKVSIHTWQQLAT